MTQIVPQSHPPAGSTKLVFVALVIAAAAVLLVNGYLELMRRQVQEDAFVVYRFTQSLEPGTPLERDMLEPIEVDSRFEEAFSNSINPTGLDARLGEQVRRFVRRADVLTYDLFTNPEEHELDRRITPGRRLVALPVNPRTVPGGLRPGMYVDIEAPFPGSGTNVMPVIENVQVIQVGDHSIIHEGEGHIGPRRIGNFRAIGIEVSPREATQLARISRAVAGDFEIQVRNPGDQDYEKIPEGGINPDVLALLDNQ